MKKINSTYINNLVSKIINETLEERADSLVSKIKSNVNELGGMDDDHPTFGKLNLSKMSDEEIEDLLNKPVRGRTTRHRFKFSGLGSEDKNKWDEIDEESEVCECGGGMYEGECMECGKSYMGESINDVDNLDNSNEYDYVQEEDDVDFEGEEEEEEYMNDQEDNSDPLGKTKEACNKDSENYSQETCIWYKQNFGSDKGGLDKFKFSMNEKLVGNQKRIDKNKNNKIDAEDFRMLRKKSKSTETEMNMNEKLVGNQKRIDKNKNNKIDAEDFKMLRKGGETDEQWQGLVADMAVAAAPSVATWALDKAFGESNESKKKSKSILKLSESEMIDLIEKIVLEDKEKVKSNIKNLTEPKGLSTYKRAVKTSGKENDDYIKSVAKKMKDYLKDGSKGDYETNPKHFPKNNGGLAKMKKMAYEVSKDGEEFLDDYMKPGMENLDYDEIQPNEDWMKDNIEGSSRTGNNPEWINAEKTELGAKLNKKRKENKFAKAKRAAYNKSPQPIVSDKPGQESGKGLNIKTESTEPKTDKKLNEEFEKMKSLISYDRKTQ
jgi:hypothetical protein